jgi:DNA invertase Pin-like site-specific DNA recombinase
MNAVALLRVSTPDQVLGLSAQRHDIEVYAASHGITVVSWHSEVISGGASFLDRPVLLAAIADLAVLRADYLIASKWDRLSRDPMTGVMIEAEARKSGATVVAADGAGNGNDPAAELFRGMLLLFGQFERRMIGVRTKAAMAVKKARGELVGRPPRGWTSVDGKLVRVA